VPAERIAVIAPSIDPFSPKNQLISDSALPRFLAHMGLLSKSPDVPAVFTRRDGSLGEVVHRAALISDRPPLDAPSDLVVQVSRWDRLKDMRGVMMGFATGVVGRVDAHLALAGPAVDGVTDDPEGAEVLAECVAAWESLPAAARRRISLVSLPMYDIDENAAMVNALQRAATVIVQKSLAEGFGLTVAEGMWKAKPIVASRVGGIIDQVVPGTGILLDDPTDLDALADALVGLLASPADIARMGDNARRYVIDEFVGDRHLLQYADLIERLISDPAAPGSPDGP
jgi:trehalose synthase